MIQKKQAFQNAVLSVLQVVIVGGSVFFLYRFLLDEIGASKLGLWSVIISATSLTNVVNLGLAGGVVKFVAQYIAQGKDDAVYILVETAFLSLGIVLAIGLTIIYLLIEWILKFLIPTSELAVALQLVPWVAVAFWLSTMGQVFQATLDGYQRIDLRSIFLMSNDLLYLFVCFALVPNYGIMGLSYAFLLRSILALLVPRLLLLKLVPNMSWFPMHWDYQIFKEIMGYGVNFQIVSILVLMLDPITKGLISYFGGLSATGYYEMAYRMIVQFRGILIAANSIVVPIIADLKEKRVAQVSYLYQISFRLMLFISLPFYSLIIIMIPILSRIWIGFYEQHFGLFATVLAIAYMINTLSAPAYFANLGLGTLRDNVFSHLIMATINLVAGYWFGLIWGGDGVIFGTAAGLILGSSYLLYTFSLRKDIARLKALFDKADALLLLGNVLAIVVSFNYYRFYFASIDSIIANVTILSCIFLVVTSLFVWRHSMRVQMQMWVFNVWRARFLNKPTIIQ